MRVRVRRAAIRELNALCNTSFISLRDYAVTKNESTFRNAIQRNAMRDKLLSDIKSRMESWFDGKHSIYFAHA